MGSNTGDILNVFDFYAIQDIGIRILCIKMLFELNFRLYDQNLNNFDSVYSTRLLILMWI